MLYRERKPKRKITWWVIAAAVILLAVLLAVPVRKRISRNLEEQSIRAVRDAVMRSAVQCYAVEGMYPASMDYLEEHYGLEVNHERFIVSYDVFASNMAPSIRVLQKGRE